MTTIQLPDGATIEYLTPVEDGSPCLMRGTIPAGGVVPLHSHADPETFIVLAGEPSPTRTATGSRSHPATSTTSPATRGTAGATAPSRR